MGFRVLGNESPRLLYDLISPREQRGGHIEPEDLRGLQVDHQLVLGRLLNRQVPGVGATKDAIHVCSHATPLVDLVDPVGDETAILCMEPKWIDRRELMSRGQLDNQFASCKRMRCHNETAIRYYGKLCYAAFDFIRVVDTLTQKKRSHRLI